MDNGPSQPDTEDQGYVDMFCFYCEKNGKKGRKDRKPAICIHHRFFTRETYIIEKMRCQILHMLQLIPSELEMLTGISKNERINEKIIIKIMSFLCGSFLLDYSQVKVISDWIH